LPLNFSQFYLNQFCGQCGSTARSSGVLGLQVCNDCGAVRSFASDIRSDAGYHAPVHRPLLRATPQPGMHARLARSSLQADSARVHRIARCRQAIELLSESVRLQHSVNDPATALLVRHCQATKGVPSSGPRLKRLVSACVLAASARQGLGLTIHEVAAQAHLPLREVQKAVWKVCKVNGVRLVRGQQNVDAFLYRLCEQLQLSQQRSAVCTTASRLVSIANEGWMATGRKWVFVVAAAFTLAARAYHFEVRLESLARVLAIRTAGIEMRLRELSQLLQSQLSPLPWGHMVTVSNIHSYLLFAVDYFDVLKAAAPELTRKRREEEQGRADAGEPVGAKKPKRQYHRLPD